MATRKDDDVSQWLVGLIISLIISTVAAVAGVGWIAAAAAAHARANDKALDTHTETARIQFDDIKGWLIRIDRKLGD